MAHIQIKTSHGRGEIFVDGEKLRGVTGFEVRGSVGEPERVTVELVMINGAEIETNATVEIPHKTRESLILLGWTPPAS